MLFSLVLPPPPPPPLMLLLLVPLVSLKCVKLVNCVNAKMRFKLNCVKGANERWNGKRAEMAALRLMFPPSPRLCVPSITTLVSLKCGPAKNVSNE